METHTFNHTDTSLNIQILIPFKQTNRVGDMPLDILTHIHIQHKSSTRA